MADLIASLVDFGADPSAVRLFDTDTPICCLTRRSWPRVVETMGSLAPCELSTNGKARRLYSSGCRLACGRRPVTSHTPPACHAWRRTLHGCGCAGRLNVYRIELDKCSLRQAHVEVGVDDDEKYVTLARLGNLRPRAAISQRGWISNVVLNLLTGSITRLIEWAACRTKMPSLGPSVVHSFSCRSQPVARRHVHRHGRHAVRQPSSSKSTSKWLDATFNGDLLPLSDGIFDVLAQQAFLVLGDVLRRAPDSQLFLGWQEKWDNLDFAHIPVGVLSQAYELYLRNHAPDQQKREGGFYSPNCGSDGTCLVPRSGRNGTSRDAKVLIHRREPAFSADGVPRTGGWALARRWRASQHTNSQVDSLPADHWFRHQRGRVALCGAWPVSHFDRAGSQPKTSGQAPIREFAWQSAAPTRSGGSGGWGRTGQPWTTDR